MSIILKHPTPTQEQSPISRTNSLVRKDLPIGCLVANELNPNEMDEAGFNMLYDNVEKMGITDPILVRPLGVLGAVDCTYKIVGGHHRWEVAKLQGFEVVPVTIITDPDFDEDSEKFQVIRHNVIRGKMSPKKFMDLYQSLSLQYTEDVAAEMFGFTSEDEFRKLIQTTAKSLPHEMKDTFLAASKEIKTIGDLSALLNRLFTTYGDTVPYGYMIFDYGGQDHVWLRMAKGQKKDVASLGMFCQEHKVSLPDTVALLLQLIAQNTLDMETFLSKVESLPKVSPEEVSSYSEV